ncbi:MAG: hypothetical protein L6R36_007957 [Xanthoria steineri]|nr:MAG: hypothetical protein L6R36_007957 [Xanthoria steineri]
MYRNTLFLTSLLLSTSTAVLVDYQSNFTAAACSCANTNDTGATTGSAYICRDPRLGPVQLPTVFPLLSFVSNYDRFGGLQPGEFLARWTDNATGNYRYPPQNGFQLDLGGRPILGNMSLLPGMQVDRFGSEYGSFISAADAPYAQRALPPASLDTSPTAPEYPYSYHVYTVRKRLDVLGGPIAPWFGQPGLGVQFFTGAIGNVMTLIQMGFLERDNITAMVAGSGTGGTCG